MNRIAIVLAPWIGFVWIGSISAAETRELHFKSPADGMRFTAGLPIQVWADVIPRDDDHPGWPAAECRCDGQQVGERVLGNKRAYDYFPFTVPGTLVTAGRHTLTLAGFGREGPTVPPERSMTVEVDPWPADKKLVELTDDVTATDLEWNNVAVRGNGHTVTVKGSLTVRRSLITGLGSIKIVDPSHADPDSVVMTPGLTASLTGDVDVEDSIFEATGAIHLAIRGDCTATIANNEFRASNFVKFVPSRPEASPVILISETDAGSKPRDAAFTVDSASRRVQDGSHMKRFQGNRIASGIVRFHSARDWLIGGETDALSNILIGPRCVLSLVNCRDLHVIGNYIHHQYRGTWSQGYNFYCENSEQILAEHNVLRSGSWPLQSFAGEFRYNLMIDAGHNWVRTLKSGTRFHHNLLVHTGDPYGTGIGAGLWLYNNCKNVEIYNNTFDGGAPVARDFNAPLISLSTGCSLSALRNNVFTGIRPINGLANNAVIARGGKEQDREPRIHEADYNCFFNPDAPAAAHYEPGIVGKPPGAHDINADPRFEKGRLIPYAVNESDVWNRKLTVSHVLAAYRERYRPADGSPLLGAGDPAEGQNSYIGAIGPEGGRPGYSFGTFSAPLDQRLGLATPKAAPSPAFRWQTATPKSQAMASTKLNALWDDLAKRKTTALLIVRNDRIIFERYAPGWDAKKPHGTASLAKALVGGLSLAVAITDGMISLDDPAAKFIPQWKDDPRKQRILIRHLGSHTSGLDDAEDDNLAHEALTGWKGDFWKRLDPPRDPFTIARDQTPTLFDPGAELQYSNPAIGMLTYAVTASLKKDSRQADIRSLLRDRVMRPIGVPEAEWSVGYGKTITVDGLPLVASWGGGSLTPRAVAAIGRLLLREGDWDGRQLLSAAAVSQITGDAGQPGHCGMGFFTNSHGRYSFLPRDTYWGAGAGDQVLLVIPSLKMIVVRNGETLEAAPPAVAGEKKPDIFTRFHDPRSKILFEPLMSALTDAAPAPSPAAPAAGSLPLPRRETSEATVQNPPSAPPSNEPATAPYLPSPIITGIKWSPISSIIRRAEDSDNWPLTWADDDALYAAYGDGTGFDPKVPEKLSLGFARLDGGPTDFKGANIRSATGERKGDGPRGVKASGLLMVDGVLYMLARNAGNSQLAWSADHAKTWTWANWKFTTSFGCPTFLNFSKNYGGARDDFVYIYSPDSDTAYTPADRVVLARIRKDQLKTRAAYEFFAGLDSTRRPTWSADIARRAGVFAHPGHCFRPTVSYNPGLHRYLLVQAGSTREVDAGFGIYDAPEPWGPWTTVTYAAHWDTSPGETASIPTKWISADGRTLYLVFSGGDALNVRQAQLKVAVGPADVPAGPPTGESRPFMHAVSTNLGMEP